MGQKLVHNFLQQEAGAFGNNIGKEPRKPRLKLKMQVADFCKHLLICKTPTQIFSLSR